MISSGERNGRECVLKKKQTIYENLQINRFRLKVRLPHLKHIVYSIKNKILDKNLFLGKQAPLHVYQMLKDL